MTKAQELAAFGARSSYDLLSADARDALKVRILDALGCAFGALGGEPPRIIRGLVKDFGGARVCTLIGGGRTSPDRAALYNSALVRYLDFNDSYLARHETCHPSDNLGAVLAAAEYADCDGREFLAALALAYQVQCRLSDEAPVRKRGFDHVTQGVYALAAGVSRALGLDPERTASAIGIAGTAFNALRVTRTGTLSNWKGLAYPNAAFGVTHAVFLAMGGITGPLEVFEGNKGFEESIAGPFAIDWAREDLERVCRTIVKRYNAEVHSQSVLEGVLDLKKSARFSASDVDRVDIEVFDVAYNIIGGGEEGDKKLVQTKEQADHSLPYLVAAAILDDTVMPDQYAPDRIVRQDVQDLLRRVTIRPVNRLSQRFPEEMPCAITVELRDGRALNTEKTDYEGFVTRPMQWDTAVTKFEHLSAGHIGRSLRRRIVEAVGHIETVKIRELTQVLRRVS